MPQEQLVRAFANDVLIRIDRAADQRLAKPARRVDDDLVREPGDRIDGEADARHFRSNHPLDQDGDFDRVDGQPGRLPIGMRARRPGRGTTGRHRGREPAARHVEQGLVDTRKRVGRDCPRRCPTSGRQRGSRPAGHRTTDAPRPPQPRSSPASAKITRPSGTGNPACFRRAQLKALPPARASSAARTRSRGANGSRGPGPACTFKTVLRFRLCSPAVS